MASLYESPSGWLLDYAGWQDVVCSGTAPSCRALLNDPFNVLTDKTRWPRHICEHLLTASLVRWSIRRIIGQHLVDSPEAERWMEYASNHQTLPVDRSAILGRVLWQARHDFPEPSGHDGDWRFSDLMGAFDHLTGNRTHLFGFGDELEEDKPETIEEAALIVEDELGGTEWALYFLAIATNCNDDIDAEERGLCDLRVNGLDWQPPYDYASFSPSRVRMTIAGNPAEEGLAHLYRNAADWWTKAMAGLRVRGRPPGAYWTMGRIETLRDEYRTTTGESLPTRERFMDWLDDVRYRTGRDIPSESTVKSRLSEVGIGWRAWWKS